MQKRKNQKEEKIPIISTTNASPHPRTMVIVMTNAPITSAAVATPRRPIKLASGAPLHFNVVAFDFHHLV